MPASATASPARATAVAAVLACRRSPNANTPISRLVMASKAIWPATAVPSEPARSEAWERSRLSAPTTSSASTCQSSSALRTPSSRRPTTTLVTAALRPNRTPVAHASATAPRRQDTQTTPHAANVAAQAAGEPSARPPAGSATVTNSARPAATATAAAHSARRTRRRSSGSANTSVETSSGCTTASRPTASAAACAA